MLSCHDDNYLGMAKLTIYGNKAEYAARWGHDLYTLTGVSAAFRDQKSHVNGITWDRFNVALAIVKSSEYDWVYIVGCDTLITNMTIPLSSFIDPEYSMIIANDCNEWNADSFLLRCHQKTAEFMADALRQRPSLRHHCWVEQQAMIEVRHRHPGLVKTLPQRMMNSYNYDLYPNKGGRDGLDYAGHDGQWQPGDFLIHWAGLPTYVRDAEISKTIPMIVR